MERAYPKFEGAWRELLNRRRRLAGSSLSKGLTRPSRSGRKLPTPGARVCRGGSVRFLAHYARSADRGYYMPTGYDDSLGVRPARVITD